MKTKTPPSEPETKTADPAKDAAAFERLRKRLSDIPREKLLRINLSVESAALAVLGVAKQVTQAALYARFKSLPAAEFQIGHVDDLEDTARAALHAAREAERLSALSTEVKVPLALSEEADAVEGRMQALSEYHFSDDPEIAPILDLLRPGSGHRDKANDLFGYADIYGQRQAVVEKDTKYYHPGDRVRAVQIAEEIQQHIANSMSPAQTAAMDQLVRARTFLGQTYEEVRRTGEWLERADPKSPERYPSLYTAGRATTGGRPKKAKAPATEGKTG